MKSPCSTQGAKKLVYWVKACKIDDVAVKLHQAGTRCEAVAVGEGKLKH